MPIISFSGRDLKRGTVVEPAWYRCRVDSIGEQPAKVGDKGPSTNYPVEVTILFNGDNGSSQFAEVPIDFMFNSKAIGFAVPFLQAFGVELKPGVRVELKSAEGREIDIFVENDTWQGRLVNRVNHKYRAINPAVSAVPYVEPTQPVNA